MVESNRTAELRKIRDEVLSLTDSPLYNYRKAENYFPVIGEGSHEAKIMFVGEAPGQNEAKTGRPFCGRAGKILDELLASAGLARAEVYVTNIVKDRPPGNRDPLPEEIAIYAPFLDRQIEIIQPQIIATLGRFSMGYLLKKFELPEAGEPISRLHGRPLEVQTSYGRIKLIPLYHPAVAIYTQSMKDVLIKDFQILRS